MKSFIKSTLEKLFVGLFKEDTTKNMNINNWQGKITYTNLELSDQILEKFNIDLGLPLSVIKGNIQELSITVPWSNILSESLILTVKNATAIMKLDMMNLEKYRRMSFAADQKTILEKVERRIIDSFRQAQNAEVGYISSFMEKLLQNLVIKIENLAIRFEIFDILELRSSVTVKLDEFAYKNSQEEGESGRKQMKIQGFGVYLQRNNLLLNVYRDEDLVKMDMEELRAKIFDLSNSDALLAPINIITTTKRDPDNNKVSLRNFDISPINVSFDSRNFNYIKNLSILLKSVKLYKTARFTHFPFRIENEEIKLYLNKLKLVHLFQKFYKEKMLKDKEFRRNAIDNYLLQRWKYELFYEIKILHLMENEFQIANQKIFTLESKIKGYDQEELTVEEAIQNTLEFEEINESSDILKFRENVMAKLRNHVYLRAKLNQRLKYVKKNTDGGIGGIISSSVGKVWSFGRKKETMEDFIKEVSKEKIEQSEGDLDSTVVKIALSCPIIMISIIREEFTLIKFISKNLKGKMDSDYNKNRIEACFKISKFMVESDNGYKYLQILEEEKKYCISYNFVLNIEEVKSTLDEVDYRYKLEESKIRIGEVYVKLMPSLVSNFLYMLIQLPGMDKESISLHNLPEEFTKKTSGISKQLFFVSQNIQNIEIVIKDLKIFLLENCEKKIFLVNFIPKFVLENREFMMRLDNFSIKYGILLFKLNDFEKQNLKGILRDFTPVCNEFDYKITVLPRSKHLISIESALEDLQFYINDELLINIYSLISEFLSIKLLSSAKILRMSSKAPLKKSIKKKKKKFTSNFKSQMMNLLRKRSTRSSAKSTTRKNSGGTNYFSMGSDLDEEESDQFYDVFEEESELLCYNELQKTAQILEGANQVFTNDLDVIEEFEVEKISKNRKIKEESGKRTEISLSVFFGKISIFFFNKDEILENCSLSFNKIKFFKDAIVNNLKIENVDILLKQNLIKIVHSFGESTNQFLKNENVKEFFKGSLNNIKDMKGKEGKIKAVEEFISSISQDFDFSIKKNIRLYMAEKSFSDGNFDSKMIQPSAFMKISPALTINGKDKLVKGSLSFRLYFFNTEIQHYEPLIEEFSSTFEISKTNLDYDLKGDLNIENIMVNLKPSLFTHILDTISLFSTTNLKLSAEKNSILRIENFTGLDIDCSILDSNRYKRIKGYDKKEMNLIVLPKNRLGSEQKDNRDPDLDLNAYKNLDGLNQEEIQLVKMKDLNTDNKISLNKAKIKSKIGGGLFSQKKVRFKFGKLGISHIIDLKDISDQFINLRGSQTITIKMSIQGAKTIIRFVSNFKVENSLHFPIQFQIFREENFGDMMNIRSPFGKLAKDPLSLSTLSDTEEDSDQKYEKASSISGEGDDNGSNFEAKLPRIARTKSFNFSKGNKNFKNSKLVYSFILQPQEARRLPILIDFPEDYSFEIGFVDSQIFKDISYSAEKEFKQLKRLNNDILNDFRVQIEDLFKHSSKLIKYQLCYSKHDNLNLSVHLGCSMVKTGSDNEEKVRSKNPFDDDNRTLTSMNENFNYCEFTISVNYPITITNCLPFNLDYKFIDYSFLSQFDDNISTATLSNLGSTTLASFMRKSDEEEMGGVLFRASTEKMLFVSPHDYPMLGIEGKNGRGVIKLKKKIAKEKFENMKMTKKKTFEMCEGEEEMEEIEESEIIDNEVRAWHENRIIHLYEPSLKKYYNYFVQTSKMHDILRINISAQYLILNESSNRLEIEIEENGFTYEPLDVYPCSKAEMMQKEPLDLKGSSLSLELKSSLFNENMVVPASHLQNMISIKEFSAFSNNGYNLLRKRSDFITTFTGDANNTNKQLKIKLKGISTGNLSTENLLNSQEPTKLVFNDNFKGKYKKEVCLGVKSYQLSDEFGAAQLIVIGPSYILVNESGEDLRITHLPGSKNVTQVNDGEMVKLDFRAKSNDPQINKTIYLNCSGDGYLWSAGLKIEREDLTGFELKCVSLRRSKPKVYRVDVEKKGVSLIFRVKREPPERMKIINHTSHTFKINQLGFEQYGEFVGPDGEEIGFFWDDPFALNTLQFERLFNNQNSSQGFTLDLKRFTKKQNMIIDLNKDKQDSKFRGTLFEKKQNKEESLIDVEVSKAYTGDGLLITMRNIEQDQPKTKRIFKLFPRENDNIENINKVKGLTEITFGIKHIGISFNDEKPREIFFFCVENLRSRVLLDSKELKPTQLYLEIMDLQGDYQISRTMNQVMLMTKRDLKKKRFTDFFYENQLKPFLRIQSNFTYNKKEDGEYTLSLLTMDVKVSLLILRLNGKSFNRFYRLINQMLQLYTQSVALLSPPEDTNEGNINKRNDNFSNSPAIDENNAGSSNFGMVTLRISEIDCDIFFENLPELISTFSQSYLSKIFSVILKDIGSFYVRLSPLGIERRYINDEVGKHVMNHYVSQAGTQVFKSIANSEMIGNSSRAISNMTANFVNMVKGSKGKTTRQAREAFLAVFDAYSQVNGNFHHTVLRKFFDDKDLNKWKSLRKELKDSRTTKQFGVGERIVMKASEIVQNFLVPFSDPFNLTKKQGAELGDDFRVKNDSSFSILKSRKAKRPPRFFFKSIFLIPYSSIKAKLQMAIDSRDIELGTFFNICKAYAILVAPSRIVIISRMLEKPISTIEYEKIYSIRFFKATERNQGTCDYLKVTFYDKEKFLKGVLEKRDPFQKSEKWIRLKLDQMNKEVVTKFERKIEDIKAEGFFFNWI